MTVFRMLFNHWKEFITYRSKLPADESLLNHLQEKLTAQRAENKAKREASERRRLARLSAERKKKEKEERERKRMEDLARYFDVVCTLHIQIHTVPTLPSLLLVCSLSMAHPMIYYRSLPALWNAAQSKWRKKQ